MAGGFLREYGKLHGKTALVHPFAKEKESNTIHVSFISKPSFYPSLDCLKFFRN